MTVEYINGVPNRVDTIVIAAQHSGEADIHRLRQDIIAKVILPVIPEHMVDLDTKIHINPTGRFVSGGPQADSGLTGRKIIVDTYGGYARHAEELSPERIRQRLTEAPPMPHDMSLRM